MPGIASAATSVVIGHIAAGTRSIRVGAGGIMLPNHAPYVIAEQFGTLARLFPGRIDLGLGRAPGTDQLTLRALRRAPESAENFPQDVLELQAYLAPAAPGQRIQAVPAAGTELPIWILGSSTFRRDARRRIRAALFLRLAFRAGPASSCAGYLPQPTSSRRSSSTAPTRWSASISSPPTTDAEARRLATTQQMSFANIFRGARGLSQPPIDDIESYWTPMEKAQAMRMLVRSIIGSAGHDPSGDRRARRRDRRRRTDRRIRHLRACGATAVLRDHRRRSGRRRVGQAPRPAWPGCSGSYSAASAAFDNSAFRATACA